MNLFKNRPLALVCAVIIFVSFIAYKLQLSAKLFILAAAFALLAISFVISRRRRELKVRAIFACLLALGAILSALTSIIGTDLKAERARALEGDGYAELLIINDRTYDSFNSYDARLREVDGERVSFDAVLYLSFDATLEPGDIVRVRAEVCESGLIGGLHADGAEVDVFVYNSEDLALISRRNLTPRVLFVSLRERTAEYLEDCFGGECGALARGVFLGDTDGISGEVIRDFRRAGVSHLLAVSGLHISMLMAMAELLMRGLGIGKRVRCVILAVLSLAFLGMTGFAMSACRSVFMLLFVYLHFIFAKESDSLSALFAAVALIMLISSDAAADVGLWLSFLATLGIISVYSPMVRYLKSPRRHGFRARALRVLVGITRALLLSFVCSIFTSLVVWLVFGEASVMTLVSNLVLTPIALAFLILIPIGMIVGRLGIIGNAVIAILRALSELLGYLCGVFASVDGALISLGYGFAGVIIVALTASLFVMLIINMKHKALILAPPIAAVLAFVICLSVYNGVNADKLALTYQREDSNEMIVMSECGGAAVIDISSGSYRFMMCARRLIGECYATEIEELVLTHYHDAQSASLDALMQRTVIRRIYLPKPTCEADALIAVEILSAAEHHGADVLIYESGDTLELLSDTRVRIDIRTDTQGAVAVFIANKTEAFCYISDLLRESEGAERFSSLADHTVFGVHGGTFEPNAIRSDEQKFILH